jgi:23S rRNA (adenine2503-C2)-methyltransferase
MDIKSMDYNELAQWVSSVGEKPFRAKQLYDWIHVKLVRDESEMLNIPKSLKEKIKEQGMYKTEVVTRLESKEDGTNKFLFKLYDGNVIESVLMKYKHGNSVCISSQAGCRMGCRFCASTIEGLNRNLEVSEMLDQIYNIQRISGERVSNVVVMGTGEP